MKLLNPEHPLKTKLKELKITQTMAAFNVGSGYQQFYKYLNGSCRMPEGVEKKLIKLIQRVESGQDSK